ncbi:hypothetical protein FKM82_022630 [Ascaphus truei]
MDGRGGKFAYVIYCFTFFCPLFLRLHLRRSPILPPYTLGFGAGVCPVKCICFLRGERKGSILAIKLLILLQHYGLTMCLSLQLGGVV